MQPLRPIHRVALEIGLICLCGCSAAALLARQGLGQFRRWPGPLRPGATEHAANCDGDRPSLRADPFWPHLHQSRPIRGRANGQFS